MSGSHRFQQKFAAVCEEYLQDVIDHFFDKPRVVPLFSRLSLQQRLALVKDVMIGVLC